MKWPSAPKVLTALLVVLLPVLAFMQYRWVGQVSEASRERMQRNLQTAADQFRESFDREVLRAGLELQVGPATAREGFSDRYSEAYSAWFNSADHPQIVAEVFVVDAASGQLRLRRWNANTHVFELSLWPAALGKWRPQFERAYAEARAGVQPDLTDAFNDDESFIVMGLRGNFGPRNQPSEDGPSTPAFGFTVIELDMSYLRGQMIPALAERHFIAPESDVYRVAVVADDDAREVLYRSDPDVALDEMSADVTARLVPGRGFWGLPRRGGAGRNPAGPGRQPGRGGNDLRAEEAPGRWRLIVQHQSGSLEAAV